MSDAEYKNKYEAVVLCLSKWVTYGPKLKKDYDDMLSAMENFKPHKKRISFETPKKEQGLKRLAEDQEFEVEVARQVPSKRAIKRLKRGITTEVSADMVMTEAPTAPTPLVSALRQPNLGPNFLASFNKGAAAVSTPAPLSPPSKKHKGANYESCKRSKRQDCGSTALNQIIQNPQPPLIQVIRSMARQKASQARRRLHLFQSYVSSGLLAAFEGWHIREEDPPGRECYWNQYDSPASPYGDQNQTGRI
ncbi:hypothetical protein N0V90_007622 [Kalmusia sp. IMI 367209]|nr:hypothetical protein N0V90_007622 [Kalmusia sp. IMI 367209]